MKKFSLQTTAIIFMMFLLPLYAYAGSVTIHNQIRVEANTGEQTDATHGNARARTHVKTQVNGRTVTDITRSETHTTSASQNIKQTTNTDSTRTYNESEDNKESDAEVRSSYQLPDTTVAESTQNTLQSVIDTDFVQNVFNQLAFVYAFTQSQ